MRIRTGLLWLMLAFLSVTAMAQKREFRGAWIQCVNGQFQNMGTERMQQNLTWQLDELKKSGINAILFQVRPEGDALYQSKYEPWSRFLTGVQGQAPSPYWDPLEWMVKECHKRGMECHAWLNPYRAKTKGTKQLASNHEYVRNPSSCFWYDEMLIFDPGQEANRKYFCKIIDDIVSRYDVDGIHIDDYFYPYPVAGKEIPDYATYQANPRGFADIRDWRRDNVNLLIRDIHSMIRSKKPWMKFGISPFGIYRNQSSDSRGSNTHGTQNYDDLYADILLWIDKGWVDYTIPQVYWEIGHKAADYETLVKWWSVYASKRPLYIGQDVMRTVKAPDLSNPSIHQMRRKYELQRTLSGIQGSCQWPALSVVENQGGYADMLRQVYHRYPALQPSMPFIDSKAPQPAKKLKIVWIDGKRMLFWKAPKAKSEMDRAAKYVVYRFERNERINTNDPSHIVAITPNEFIEIGESLARGGYTYVVTALDRLDNESRPAKRKVK